MKGLNRGSSRAADGTVGMTASTRKCRGDGTTQLQQDVDTVVAPTRLRQLVDPPLRLIKRLEHFADALASATIVRLTHRCPPRFATATRFTIRALSPLSYTGF